MSDALAPAVIANLRARFGGDFRPVSSTVSVGTAATVLLGHDMERCSLAFVNLSNNEVYVNIAADVSTVNGIRLGPLGGTVALDVYEDNILPAWEWWAIATGAASTVLVLFTKRDTRS